MTVLPTKSALSILCTTQSQYRNGPKASFWWIVSNYSSPGQTFGVALCNKREMKLFWQLTCNPLFHPHFSKENNNWPNLSFMSKEPWVNLITCHGSYSSVNSTSLRNRWCTKEYIIRLPDSICASIPSPMQAWFKHSGLATGSWNCSHCLPSHVS